MPEQFRVTGQDWWLQLARPRAWLWFLGLYLLLHMGMRLLFSDTLQLDDAEQLVQSQAWRLDYGNFQPPFYTWVLWALWHVLDPSLWVLYLIRYLIIGLSFWLWYRVSLLLFDDPRWQVASASSWLLLGEFAWKLHQGSTHTTLLTLALLMSLHAIVLLLRSPRLRHYLYLGLAVGLGMMAKYSYAGFLLPMLVAALAAPDTRDRLLRWPMLFALGMAALVMLPALLSLFAADAPVADRLQDQTSYQLGGLVTGDPAVLLQFGGGALAFLAPLWLVYAAIFKIPLFRSSPASGGGWEGEISVRALLNRFHLAVLVCVVGIALFVGIDHLKSRWLHPFLTLVPFWWLLHASAHPVRRHAWTVLKWVTVALTVLVVVARLWQVLATPYVGKKPSRVTWPVAAALRQLPPGLLDSPALAVPDTFLAAHIRVYAHRKVDTTLTQPDAGSGRVWMWGGLDRVEPEWAKRLSTASGRPPQWAMAQRGTAQYWIGWLR
jgi:4-amino-4-deoxy-L-arabinose transferase-like glycosyltransferase